MVSFASKRPGALALLLLVDIAFRLYYYWLLTLPLLASSDHREWVPEEASATAPHTAEVCPTVPPAVGELTDVR